MCVVGVWPVLLAVAALAFNASVAGAEEPPMPVPGDVSPLLLNNVAWVRAATKVCVDVAPAFPATWSPLTMPGSNRTHS